MWDAGYVNFYYTASSAADVIVICNITLNNGNAIRENWRQAPNRPGETGKTTWAATRFQPMKENIDTGLT